MVTQNGKQKCDSRVLGLGQPNSSFVFKINILINENISRNVRALCKTESSVTSCKTLISWTSSARGNAYLLDRESEWCYSVTCAQKQHFLIYNLSYQFLMGKMDHGPTENKKGQKNRPFLESMLHLFVRSLHKYSHSVDQKVSISFDTAKVTRNLWKVFMNNYCQLSVLCSTVCMQSFHCLRKNAVLNVL